MNHEICGLEHVHRHSDFSLLDGFATVSEYAEYSAKVNQKYLCITDHGVMGSVPQIIRESEKHKLFPVFGCELYINPLQQETKTKTENQEFYKTLSEEDKKKFAKSNHLLAIAYTNEGYKNLVRLTSWGWLHGFYRRPRINHEVLVKHKEGIIFTSGCANSEIAQAFLREFNEEEGFMMLEKYLSMLGRDHFYLELMMLDFKLQKPYDQFLIKAHQKYGLPLIISQDCLVEDSLVFTKNGYKPISQLTPGEIVLTHLGRWREVEVVASRKLRNNEKVYRISTLMDKKAFEGTGRHKVFVASKKDDIWVYNTKRLEDICIDSDYLLIPKIKNEDISKIDLVDSQIEDLKDYWACKVTNLSEVDYSGKVYDIQVEEDHTFLVNGYRVENCHYCRREHSWNQRLMLMMQTGRTIQEIEILKSTNTDLFELQDENLWMKSEEELNDKWEKDFQDVIDYELYKEAKRNTVRVCEMTRGVKLDTSNKFPQIPDANQKLKEAIAIGMKQRGITPDKTVYMKRLKEEYELICSKEFSSYFLIQKMTTDEARRICPLLLGWGDGSEAIGCGRGSCVGSLICYCLGITDVDPLLHGLLFSRFLSPSRGGKILKYNYDCPLVPKKRAAN